MRGIDLGETEKCNRGLGDKGQEVSMQRSNCANGVVRSRDKREGK